MLNKIWKKILVALGYKSCYNKNKSVNLRGISLTGFDALKKKEEK